MCFTKRFGLQLNTLSRQIIHHDKIQRPPIKFYILKPQIRHWMDTGLNLVDCVRLHLRLFIEPIVVNCYPITFESVDLPEEEGKCNGLLLDCIWDCEWSGLLSDYIWEFECSGLLSDYIWECECSGLLSDYIWECGFARRVSKKRCRADEQSSCLHSLLLSLQHYHYHRHHYRHQHHSLLLSLSLTFFRIATIALQEYYFQYFQWNTITAM